MEKRNQWKIRLSDEFVAKANLLVDIASVGSREIGSREKWFESIVTSAAVRQVELIELALAAFGDAAWNAMEQAKSCEEDGDLAGVKANQEKADSYREQIAKYEAQRLILGARDAA